MKKLLIVSGITGLSAMYCGYAAAAEDAADSFGEVEEVVVTGSRRAGRSVLDSVVPMDVLSGDNLTSVASGDLQDVLQAIVPSFNVSRSPIDDGGTFVRTPTMRGLPGGEVLVLLNGKRVHRSALISLSGEQDNKQGSHAVDLSQFPVVGIKRIEVLRDGASAQYGSDAIAGVINVILNDEPGTSGYAKWGQYQEGDGGDFQTGVSAGFPLTDKGFGNIAFEYLNSNPTSRGVQSPAAQAVIDAGGPGASAVPTPAIVWGLPNREWTRVVYNAGLEVADNTEVYLFGNYGVSEQDGSFFYRDPVSNSAFARSTLQDGPNAIFPDYRLSDRYPGGFTPRFLGRVTDFSINAGIKGGLASGMTWDLSAVHGTSEVEYDLENSINPSMGLLSPTSFSPGNLINSEQQINVDLSYPWEVGPFASPVNVAFGAEFRRETYEIEVGDEASYSVGQLTDLGVGSNGFQGYSPSQAGRNGRNSYAVYIDLETDITDKFVLGIAGRIEDYEDFGSTFNGKIAGRYQVTDNWAFRAAVSTGFRAPTVGQTNMINTGTSFTDGKLVASGILPPTSLISTFFGGEELEPEESMNYSGGLVFESSRNFSVTLDYYNIKIEDRIGLSGFFNVDDTARAILVAQAVPGASTTSNVRYFTNGFDTRSSGLDLVGTYNMDLREGSLQFSLGLNQNKLEILRTDRNALGNRAIFNIEKMVPETKGTLSVNYMNGNFSVMVRAKYFSDWTFTESMNDPEGNAVTSDAETIVDATVSYNLNEHYVLTLGAENLFDNFPDRFYPPGDCCGRIYSGASPYGFDGGFYYLKGDFNF